MLYYMQVIIMQVTITFYKNGLIRFISHLEFVRFIYRALRRTDLPFAITQGFSPRPKVAFGPALKVGAEGSLAATFFFREPVNLEDVRNRFQSQLVEGITIQEICHGKP